MSSSFIAIVLLFLSTSLAINLLLTMRLSAIIRSEFEIRRPPISVQIGAPVPEFQGRSLIGRRWVSSAELLGEVVVLVFLSAGCRKCARILPELANVCELARQRGIAFWIIGDDSPRKMRKLLRTSDMLSSVLILHHDTQRRLNPQKATPLYLFIDDRGTAKASHLIGDENWQLFVEQLHETLYERRLDA